MMMSIALERRNTGSSNNNRIEGSSSRFVLAGLSSSPSPSSCSIMSTGMFPGDQRRMIPLSDNMSAAIKEPEDDSCSSSSSSIGRNSDLSKSSMESDGEDDTEEVQSSYKGPLDTMDALEEVLPIRRGISNFYRGKSKSFTSLADVSSSTVKDIAKPDNAYTRKRKNLIACTNILDKNRSSSHLIRSNAGGISKRLANCNRGTVATAMAVGTCSSESNTSGNSNSPPSSSPRHLPPLHPPAGKSSLNNVTPSSSPPRRNFSSWRSFSLTDLQCAADSSAGSSSISKREESTKKCQ